MNECSLTWAILKFRSSFLAQENLTVPSSTFMKSCRLVSIIRTLFFLLKPFAIFTRPLSKIDFLTLISYIVTFCINFENGTSKKASNDWGTGDWGLGSRELTAGSGQPIVDSRDWRLGIRDSRLGTGVGSWQPIAESRYSILTFPSTTFIRYFP